MRIETRRSLGLPVLRVRSDGFPGGLFVPLHELARASLAVSQPLETLDDLFGPVPSHEYSSQPPEVPHHGLPVVKLAPGYLDYLVVATPQLFADDSISLGCLRPSVEALAHPVEVDADSVLDPVGVLEMEVGKCCAERTAKVDGELRAVPREASPVEHGLESLLVEIHGLLVALRVRQTRGDIVNRNECFSPLPEHLRRLVAIEVAVVARVAEVLEAIHAGALALARAVIEE